MGLPVTAKTPLFGTVTRLANLGLDFDALKWLEPFLEGQFRHFFPVPGPQQYAGNIFLIGLGARWRLP